METDNKELKEETTKKEADKKETESKEETKQPVEETAVQKKKSKKWIGLKATIRTIHGLCGHAQFPSVSSGGQESGCGGGL